MEFAFSDEEFEQRLNQQKLITKNYVDKAFNYWLEDRDDYRVPFPQYMLDELQECTLRLFLEWTFQIDDQDSITAELLSEKFNEIIQMVGLSLRELMKSALLSSILTCPDLEIQFIFIRQNRNAVGP